MNTRSDLAVLPRNEILVGDARTVLPTLPAGSVDTVITSPPYYALRDYHDDRQIGLEDSVDGWGEELRLVLRALARVLKPTGSLWLNLGDSYSRHPHHGALPKSLLLGPERLALAMTHDGWIIRNKVVWAKTNPMPTSVRDRLACSHELFYFATRTPKYFFDLDTIRIPHRSSLAKPSLAAARRATDAVRPEWAGPLAGSNVGLDRTKASGRVGHPLGKNPGDVWHYATSTWRGPHHAVYPETLLTRPLLSSCPPRVCITCGVPWARAPARSHHQLSVIGELQPVCACRTGYRPGLVLDPFLGSGTTALAAEHTRRDWLGIELNPSFAAAATERIEAARQQHARTRTATVSREPPMAA
jgi:DNA modification methylase